MYSWLVPVPGHAKLTTILKPYKSYPSIHQPCLKLLVPAWIAWHSWTSVELAKVPAASLPGPMIAVGLSRPVAGLRPMLSSCHVAWADIEWLNMPALRNWKYWEHVAMTIPGPEVIQISMHLHTFWIEGERESEPKRLRMLDCAAIAKWAATSAWFALISHVLGAEKTIQFNAPTN